MKSIRFQVFLLLVWCAAAGAQTLTITTSSPLANGVVGQNYSQTLSASGGRAPYVWAVIAGSLPANLVFSSSSGTISGRPTAGGFSSFTVQVSDSAGVLVSKVFAITIIAPNLQILTSSPLGNGTVSMPYSQTFSASGGTPPYTWSITLGSLPPGISLNPTTGVLSGTPSSAGSANFTVQVTDSTGLTASAAFSLNINASLIAITSSSPLPNGTVAAPYSTTLSVSGGVAPYTWSITSGFLPAGLTLDRGSGVISGTPSRTGTSNFTVQVTDSSRSIATQTLSITIGLPPNPTITTTSPLPGATVGVAYSLAFAVSGGLPPYRWALIGGSLPANFSFDTATGTIFGLPIAAGNSNFTVQVIDTDDMTASRTFTLQVTAAVLSITTTSPLPQAMVATGYGLALSATGGLPPYTWTVTSGALPPGITLDAVNGILSGSPSVAGNFTFTLQAADISRASVSASFTLKVVAGPPSIATGSQLPNGVIGQSYSIQLTASGGSPPYGWILLTDPLPQGLSLSSNGVIRGTPEVFGSFAFTIQLVDGGSNAVAQTFLLIINPTTIAILTASPLPGGTVGVPYSRTLMAGAGKTPYTWSADPTLLPPGLTLNATTGVLSGTPLVGGRYTFNIQVTDNVPATDNKIFTVVIDAPDLTLTTPSALPRAVIGVPYSQPITVLGGAPPYTVSILDPTLLPPGITFDGATVSGTPTAVGTFTFGVRVVDTAETTIIRAISITVDQAPLTITSDFILPVGNIANAYAQNIAVSGGTKPYRWALISGSMPPGIILNTTTGSVSGQSGAIGTYNFTVQVTDATLVKVSRAFTLTITPPPPSITTDATLPGAVVGVPYSQRLAATGGKQPYTWTQSSGKLPDGIAINALGVVAGTATATGTFRFTVQITDGATAVNTRQFTLLVTPSTLNITSNATLPAATAGVPYSQTLAADGGTAPYTWSLSAGTLPAGLSLSIAGVLSGSARAAGSASFTLQVRDAGDARFSKAFTLAIGLPLVPAVSFTGLPDLAQPAQQLRFGVSLAAAYPLPIDGQLVLTFAGESNSAMNDPATQFSMNSRALSFRIPAGTTDGVFPSPASLQTGTLAGVMTLTAQLQAGGADATPTPVPSRTFAISRAAPAITRLRARRTSDGIEVRITGYSPTREVAQAVIRAAGQPDLVIGGDAFTAWYQSADSQRFGSQFTVTQVIAGAADSVAVTLSNTIGTSPTATARVE